MRKFYVSDLVTVTNENDNVWYTHLIDGLRNTLIGRTGRVVEIDELTFTKEDLEWHRDPKRLDKYPDDWTETVYDCKVVFPFMPDRPIVFSEVHLKAFEMTEGTKSNNVYKL